MIVKLALNNCIECPNHQETSDGNGIDGYTVISCNKINKELGEVKTRWLMLGRSFIDIPDDCPLEDEYEE